jgi:hypothetical protein
LARNSRRTSLPPPLRARADRQPDARRRFRPATLEAIVAAPDEFPRDVDPRLGLYRTFHVIWSTANIEEARSGRRRRPEGIAQARSSRITPLSRQALLLTGAGRLFARGCTAI